MKIIPDLDSITIEYQIDDKEKLRDVLKKNVIEDNSKWQYNLTGIYINDKLKIYYDYVFYNLDSFIGIRARKPSAEMSFVNNSLTSKDEKIIVEVKPTQFYLLIISFILLIFTFISSEIFYLFFNFLWNAHYLVVLYILFFIIPLLVGFVAVFYNTSYAYYRDKLINNFEKLLSDNEIKFTKIKETRQKAWPLNKFAKKPETD